MRVTTERELWRPNRHGEQSENGFPGMIAAIGLSQGDLLREMGWICTVFRRRCVDSCTLVIVSYPCLLKSNWTCLLLLPLPTKKI